MAGTTGLEPAASAVTGQRSNQLNYVPKLCRDALCAAFAELALASRYLLFAGPARCERVTPGNGDDPCAGSCSEWWAVQGSNLRPPACKAGALTN